MKNKKLNFWYFIISFLILVVIFVIDKLFVEVNTIIYYILIGPAIAALGNYIVIRIQIKKSKNKTRN